MSDYVKWQYNRLYELKAVRTDGTEIHLGGLSAEHMSTYAKMAKENKWKYEIIEETKQIKGAWAKA